MFTATATSSALDELLLGISENLQLSTTQHTKAVERYQAVERVLGRPESIVERFRPMIFPQGSLRLGTTVKPRGREEYDLDLVLQLAVDSWSTGPDRLFWLVFGELGKSAVYRPMLEPLNRCIRINYRDEFHLDLLPAVRDPNRGGTCILVPDRERRCWVESNPRGYGDWFEQRAATVVRIEKLAAQPVPDPQPAREKPPLKSAVQLWKRWRDIRYEHESELAPISIILTTLAGVTYQGEPTTFAALQGVITRTALLIERTERLRVCNPSNSAEDLSERWVKNPAAYDAFCQGVQELRNDLAILAQMQGLPRLGRALERLFGERVAGQVLKEYIDRVERARAAQTLRIAPATGALTNLSVGTTVRPNTFFGE